MKKYVYRKQIKNRGCYAEILFDIEFLESDLNSLEVNFLATKWETVCRAGANIFYDYYQKRCTCAVKITVYDVMWYPADTNNLIVLFASILAFSESAGLKIDNLKLDAENDFFCFPEVRSI